MGLSSCSFRHTCSGSSCPFSRLSTFYDGTAKIVGFFSWCVSEEPPLLRKNPATSLKLPKVAKYLIKTLEDHHVEALLAACDIGTPLGFRDHLILWLFLDTGIRLSELCTLTLDRVFIRISSSPYIKIMGKGRKEREVGLHETTAELLWKYIHM